MGIVLALLALVFPRILILVLYFFTGWFNSISGNLLYILLGFLFLPFTLLWYSVVVNFFGGDWSIIPIIGMVIAIAADIGAFRTRSYRG